MSKRILWLLILIPQLASGQYCENFNTLTKTQLDSVGWDASPLNGWSVSKTGAYVGKSAFVSAGIGSAINLVSGCLHANSPTETIAFVYTFKNGNGRLKIGIQDGFGVAGTGVVWLATLPVVNVWTVYSLTFTPSFNPYRIVLYLGNTVASSKIGIDNYCLANSSFLGICTLLPIELSGFSARVLNSSSIKSGTKVRLSWQTESEQNSKSFVLLRSTNNLNFDSIGMVKASGTSVAQLHYSYEDAVVGSGQIYYRLKSIDNDGQYSFSDIVSIALSNADEQSWFISDEVFHYSGTGNTQLVIYSAQGQMVYNKMLSSDLNEDLHFLIPGIYFVRLTDSFTSMKSFVIF